MRAVDHYTEAEGALDAIAGGDHEGDPTIIAGLVGVAQAHATLALAGATALQSYARVGDSDDELLAWELAAGGES